MKIGPNCGGIRNTIDIYLDEVKLSNPFYADDELGEVWVCPRAFETSRNNLAGLVVDSKLPPGSYSHEGCAVIRLVGHVEIRITPHRGGTTPDAEAIRKFILESHDYSIELKRLTKSPEYNEWVDIVWPRDREKELARNEK